MSRVPTLAPSTRAPTDVQAVAPGEPRQRTTTHRALPSASYPATANAVELGPDGAICDEMAVTGRHRRVTRSHPITPVMKVVPTRVRIVCAEPLRAMACCVCDGLAARGLEVELSSGDAARAALREPRPPGELAVLCLAQPVDRDTRQRLLDAFDPACTGDVLVAILTTPRDVIAMVDRTIAARRGRGRRTRTEHAHPGRAVLAHPTLVESAIEPRRWGPPALVAGAVALVALTLFGTVGIGQPSAPPRPAAAPPPAAVAPRPPSTPTEVLVSAQTPVDDEEIEIIIEDDEDDDANAPRSRRRARRAPR